MFSLTRPSRTAIRARLDDQAERDFSYPDVGITRAHADRASEGSLKLRYHVDRYRVRIGTGAAAFARGCAALEQWTQFRVGFAELCWPEVHPQPGAVVGVLARAAGLWSLNCCRVLSVHDEPGPIQRSGFCYGTLPDHVAAGEERFEIEWRRGEDDSVWYAVLAFSRPGQPIARIGLPVLRFMQRRFATASMSAMVGALR